MSEPSKQQMGDGRDNYGQAAKQTGDAAKKIGKQAAKKAGQEAVKQGATEGGKAAANAAAGAVKAGVETGKAVSTVATSTASGAAAGGPWGAVIMAALSILWSMRHTLFKILICICLVIVLLITVIVSMPDIIMQNIKELFTTEQTVEGSALNASYDDLALSVEYVMKDSYNKAKEKAEAIMADSKYDTELSKEHFTDIPQNSLDYNVAYILSAYSVSMEQTGTSKEHLLSRLESVSDRMFTVKSTEKTKEVTVIENGKQKTVTVTYVVCTIEMYDEEAILRAFNINPDAQYKNFGITNLEYVEYMANALKMTVGGSLTENE